MNFLLSPALVLMGRLRLNARFGLLSLMCLLQSVCMAILYLEIEYDYQAFVPPGLLVLITGLLALLAGYVALALLSSTQSVLVSVKTAITRFAKGDLGARVKVSGSDEFADIAEAFNQMAKDIKRMIADVSSQASAVNDATQQLRSQTAAVTQSSQHQREEAAAVATTVEQTVSAIEVIATQAHDTERVSQQASELSQTGSQVIRDASARMELVAESVRQSSDVIGALDKRALEVSEILNVIRAIAEQTNLLALNAAIEAARAGEQGRGFAVVADEVRTLAERTSQATDQIGQTIEGIKTSMASAATAMNQGAEEVMSGVELSEQAVSTLSDIHQGAEDTLTRVQAISSAVQGHSDSSQHIAASAERIAAMAETNNVNLVSIAEEAERLDHSSKELELAISAFSGGTAADAKALVERGKALIEEVGEAAAFKIFSDPLQAFVDRDLYIFAYDMQGVVLAHGGNPSLVGKDNLNATDPSGKAFVAERVEVAKAKGQGWQDYVFKNPETGELEEKTSYFMRVNDVIIGCGVYK